VEAEGPIEGLRVAPLECTAEDVNH